MNNISCSRRWILSAHSGGGAALLKILEYFEPNEVQVYDATYQPTDALVKWVRKSIARDQAALAAGVGDDPAKFLRERGGSLRLFYRPLSKTEPYSLSALRAISAALRKDPNTTALLAPRYRVERTSVPHSGMPRHFGWRLLADAGADVPRASRAQ